MRSEKDEPIAVVEEPGRITNLEHSDEAMIGQADRFELPIKLKTGKAIGLPVTQSLLAGADKVIE